MAIVFLIVFCILMFISMIIFGVLSYEGTVPVDLGIPTAVGSFLLIPTSIWLYLRIGRH